MCRLTRQQKTRRRKSPVARGSEERALTAIGPQDLDAPLARHHYSLGVVAGSLALVLDTLTPLRRVAVVLMISWKWAELEATAASYYSVRMWLLRLGLYQLNCPKEQADDWIWIVDHTLQIGDHKCLVIVGIRQAAWEQLENRVLRHEDVEVIDLQPVTESNGRIVYRQLQAAVSKTGVPRAIVSDNGSDLHAGIDRFRRRHRQTVWLYDIKHKTACLLKHALESDASWSVFVAQAHRFKQQVAQTEMAALAPPQQRSKARYMNVDVLTDWAQKHLKLLGSKKAMRAAGLKPAQVEAKLGWLRKYAPQIQRWGEMLAVTETTEHYIRHEGIHSQAAEELVAVLPDVTSRAARQLRQRLLEFVQEQSQHARSGERLLGSSEVLESIIGKFKHLSGERSNRGMTGMVLSLGALVGRHAVSVVQDAMHEVTNQDVWEWCHSHFGSTVQGIRQRITNALKPEQNRRPLSIEKA